MFLHANPPLCPQWQFTTCATFWLACSSLLVALITLKAFSDVFMIKITSGISYFLFLLFCFNLGCLTLFPRIPLSNRNYFVSFLILLFQPWLLDFFQSMTIPKRNLIVSFFVLIKPRLFDLFPKIAIPKLNYCVSFSFFFSTRVFLLFFLKNNNTKAKWFCLFSHSFVSIRVVRLFSQNTNS